MEKINILTGVLLKLLVIICVAFATFFYCRNIDKDRFKCISAEAGVSIFDSKTGMVTIVVSNNPPDSLSKNPMRLTINPLTKNKNNIYRVE